MLVTEIINKDIIEAMDCEYMCGRESKIGFIISKTPSLEKEECNITDYLKFKKKFNKIILEFNEIFDKEIPKELKYTFNKKIKTLKIVDYQWVLLKAVIDKIFYDGTRATYDSYDNVIKFLVKTDNFDNLRSDLMHELLHLSSTIDYNHHGFSTRVKTQENIIFIGNMLNEGYTEKLNQENFSKVIDKNTYSDEIVLASGIERIVGKDKMQELYFKSDLLGLIRQLGFYEKDLKFIIDLIVGIDELDKEEKIKRPVKYKKLREKIASIYENKLNLQKKLELIDESEYARCKFLYINRYIKSGVAYSDNAKITEFEDAYLIEDDNKNAEYVIKDMVNINFRPKKIDCKKDKINDMLPKVEINNNISKIHTN